MERKIARGILIFLLFFLLIFGGAETENLRHYIIFVGGITVICIIALVILARNSNEMSAVEMILANQKIAKRRRSDG